MDVCIDVQLVCALMCNGCVYRVAVECCIDVKWMLAWIFNGVSMVNGFVYRFPVDCCIGVQWMLESMSNGLLYR